MPLTVSNIQLAAPPCSPTEHLSGTPGTNDWRWGGSTISTWGQAECVQMLTTSVDVMGCFVPRVLNGADLLCVTGLFEQTHSLSAAPPA